MVKIKYLTDNKSITILKADKGNATVIMDTVDYHRNIKKKTRRWWIILKKFKSICKQGQPTTIKWHDQLQSSYIDIFWVTKDS